MNEFILMPDCDHPLHGIWYRGSKDNDDIIFRALVANSNYDAVRDMLLYYNLELPAEDVYGSCPVHEFTSDETWAVLCGLAVVEQAVRVTSETYTGEVADDAGATVQSKDPAKYAGRGAKSRYELCLPRWGRRT